METSIHRAIIHHVLPHFSQNLMLRLLFRAYPGAVSLDSLKIPERPRSIPYDDEVSLNTSVRSKSAWLTPLALFFGLSLLGVALLHKVSAINGTWDLVAEAVMTGFIPEAGIPLESISYLSAFPRITRLFRTLTAIFLGVVSGSTNNAHPIQACYLLLAFFPPILLMMMVEAHRKSNRRSLLQGYGNTSSSCSSLLTPLYRSFLWVGAAQLFGLGIVLPLYFALSLFRSQHAANWSPNAHSVSLTSSTALPALILGYVVPSVWMFALANHSPMKQPAIAFWQISPVIAVILADAFQSSSAGRLLQKGKDNTSGNALQPPERSRKLPGLTTAYDAITIASALVHIFTVSFLAFSSSHSLLKTFIPQRPLEPVSTIADGMFTFLQFDLLLCAGTTMLYSVVTLDSMWHHGMTGSTVLSSMALLATGYIVVGPGASTLVLWRWREKAMEKAGGQHQKRA